jgi:uncharacterized membrane protein YgcG
MLAVMRLAGRNPACLAVITICLLSGLAFFSMLAQEPAPPPPTPPTSVQPPPAQSVQPAPAQSRPAQPYQTESPERLQQLVAPIALYTDSLVATILAATSFPAQIAQANDWLAPRRNFTPQQIAAGADQESWDPSVKALLPFPPVLQNLASNLSWTSELGDAYYNQPTDVMNAIQEMRRQAKKAGTLKSNKQIHVSEKHGYISIDPVTRDEVYVPAYNPWGVYGYALAPWPGWVTVPGIWWDGPGLYFGLGFGIGPYIPFGWGLNWWGVDWYNRTLFFHHAPYMAGGPAFFNRNNYYHGYSGFARPGTRDMGYSRGFTAPQDGAGLQSGAFSRYNFGGSARSFSARGQESFGGFGGGGFRGGGFGGGGFRGGGR